jgi:hypothetical protein
VEPSLVMFCTLQDELLALAAEFGLAIILSIILSDEA